MIILPVVVRLELGIAGLRVTFHTVCVFGLFIGDEHLAHISTLTGRFDEQLCLARVLEAEEQECRFVDGLPYGEEAVVLQDARFAGGAEGFGDESALGAREHDAPVRVVDRVRFVELARVLRQHLNRLAERAPCFPVHRVCVAHGMDVRPGLVHFAVDEEACGIWGSRSVASDHFTVEVDGDHVAGLQQPEMPAERIRPEHVLCLGIAHTDVSGNALDVPLARPVSECRGHMLELPLAFEFHGGE